MNQSRSNFKAALTDALEDLDDGIGGTIDEADLTEQIGALSVEHIIEASDLAGPDQSGAYLVLCDLLATRLSQGIDQVLGCLVFDTEPDAAALVPALMAMKRAEGFTPVLPLSRVQASKLTNASDLETFTANATLLLDVAADHEQPSEATSSTLLTEVAELIEIHSGST